MEITSCEDLKDHTHNCFLDTIKAILKWHSLVPEDSASVEIRLRFGISIIINCWPSTVDFITLGCIPSLPG